eukprot:5324200-Amphidinium_carterae.1
MLHSLHKFGTFFSRHNDQPSMMCASGYVAYRQSILPAVVKTSKTQKRLHLGQLGCHPGGHTSKARKVQPTPKIARDMHVFGSLSCVASLVNFRVFFLHKLLEVLKWKWTNN